MEMIGKERIMTALNHGQPDRVPATPDISTMIPMRLTGNPFWEIEVNRNPSLPLAYINAVKYFGIDGWLYNGELALKTNSQVTSERRIVKEADRWQVYTTVHTPSGDMTSLMISPIDNPATMVEKVVKNFKEDMPKFKHYFDYDILGYDDTVYRMLQKEMGQHGMICVGCGDPGFHSLVSYFHGNLKALTYAYYDYPELFDELIELMSRATVKVCEVFLSAGVEAVLTGGSGSITMQSPWLWRKFSLPTLQKVTRMCKQAGVLCGIHSCGKERYLVETCTNETDLDYVNPLEIPPMGDCNLKDLKDNFGHKLSLMGNLHTTEVMLFGDTDLVRLESLRAIRDAGVGGGFVLSTGDQCGRDTPDENIREMVRVCKEFGIYPLDLDKIETEILRLEKSKGEASAT